MLGAIIGDIVGSRFEFNPTNDFNFELFTDECSYTDDTICTIAIADAILKEHKAHVLDMPFGEYLHKWCRKYPHPMGGYGNSFRKWVESDNPQPYNSYGNGAAMRVSPVPWFYEDCLDTQSYANDTSLCTHNHPEGQKGAEAVALTIFGVLEHRMSGKPITREEIADALCWGWSMYEEYENIPLEKYRNKFDETCQGTVPAALKIIEESNSFEEAIRKAVSLGADADTLGAIVGSIAEAIWGIPEWMKKKALTYLPEEMRQVLRDFHKACPKRPKIDPVEMDIESEDEKMAKAIMFWKLAWGNPNVQMGLAAMEPISDRVATARDWNILPMPDEGISELELNLLIPSGAMERIKKGHIPPCQEDHWFMYTDEQSIHIYRSWTGMCAYKAQYHKEGEDYQLDKVRINRNLAEFGVNGDKPAVILLKYLLMAAGMCDAEPVWQEYLKAWKEQNKINQQL